MTSQPKQKYSEECFYLVLTIKSGDLQADIKKIKVSFIGLVQFGTIVSEWFGFVSRREDGGPRQLVDPFEQRGRLPQQRRQLSRDARPQEHEGRLHPRRPRYHRRPRPHRNRDHLQEASAEKGQPRGRG